MAAPKMTINKLNSQLVRISGLHLKANEDSQGNPTSFLNNADATVTLLDPIHNQPVPGLTNVTATYVVGSNGVYEAPIDPTFDPATGSGYHLIVTATQAAAQYYIKRLVEITDRDE